MPDTVSMPQPPRSLHLRNGKESLGRQMGRRNTSPTGFPEYLKHVDMLGSNENGFKITASNSLFQVVLKGRVRSTEYMLDRGTAVNGRNDYGFSVLTAALHIDNRKRRDRMFRLLLERGADPHFKDGTFQRNVLHWACVLGHAEQVEVLLKEVAVDLDLREKDSGSYTALHHAVMTGQLPVVVLLVDIHRKFGVTVDLADNLGLTPYLHAKRLGYRDVAGYLLSEGMASQGHGDMLFRTPREWSQIGKFERQKAVDIQAQEAINNAKIQGNIKHLRSLENSPRNGVPSLVLPTSSPSHSPRAVRLAAGRHSHPLSTSLPSLQEDKYGSGSGRPTKSIMRRPTSANGVAASTDGDRDGGADSVDNANITHYSVDSSGSIPPGPPKEAFVHEASPPTTLTTSKDPTATTTSIMGPRRPHHLLPPGGGKVMVGRGEGREEGVALLPLPAIKEGEGLPVSPRQHHHQHHLHHLQHLQHQHQHHHHSAAAFTLMEMNVKGRHASTYRQSQFDETKASEYKHILGNLNTIMDILSQQQSRSFRKSVKYQRPETPKKVKPKQKVSSLAVIFGRDKNRRSRRRSGRQQTSSSSSKKKESASTKKKKEKGGGGDEKKPKATAEQKKKVVPLLKVNDKVV